MHAFLITGGSPEQRLFKAKDLIKNQGFNINLWENNPDLLIVEPKLTIGIFQIRKLQQFLSRRPYQEKIKVALIPQAEKLTIPAQNSFLKTLEEPPANSILILTTQSADILLATIVSRCEMINLNLDTANVETKILASQEKLFSQLIKASPGQRLTFIENFEKSREEAIKFSEDLIKSMRTFLISRMQKKEKTFYLKALKDLIKAHKLLTQTNVNHKLILDNFCLTLPCVSS